MSGIDGDETAILAALSAGFALRCSVDGDDVGGEVEGIHEAVGVSLVVHQRRAHATQRLAGELVELLVEGRTTIGGSEASDVAHDGRGKR